MRQQMFQHIPNLLVLSYIDEKHNVQERSFEFIPLQSATSESIATALRERLAAIIPEDQKSKLIFQAYDGASVMGGATTGVQRKIKHANPNGHYVHCNDTSYISKVRIFFADLGGSASFFSRSPKRTAVLDKMVAHRLPTASNVSWNFHSRAIDTVFEHREDLSQCFENIPDSGVFDTIAIREAGAMPMLLQHQDFKFFLDPFHLIMPHMDLFYAKLQKKILSTSKEASSSLNRTYKPSANKDSLHSMGEESSGCLPAKRRQELSSEDHQRVAEEVCSTILGHTSERFPFTDHLVCGVLLQRDRLEEHHRSFPEAALHSPMLNGSKLKTGLGLIYSKEEIRACCGPVDLFHIFMENNVEEVLSETVILLKIIIATPNHHSRS